MIDTLEIGNIRVVTHTLASMAEVVSQAANFQAFCGKKVRATCITPKSIAFASGQSLVKFTT